MKKVKTGLALFVALILALSCSSLPVFAASDDNCEDVLIASTSFYTIVDEENKTVDFVEGDLPIPYGSSVNTTYPNNSTGTISLYKSAAGSVDPYYVKLTLTAVGSNHSIARIKLKVRPNDVSNWTSLDKPYDNLPKSITERLPFASSKSASDLSVSVQLTQYIDYGGAFLDNWAYSGTLTLDFK